MSAPHRQVWNGDRSVYQLAADLRRAWDAKPCRWSLKRRYRPNSTARVEFDVLDRDGSTWGALGVTADGRLVTSKRLDTAAKADIDAAEALARVTAALEAH